MGIRIVLSRRDWNRLGRQGRSDYLYERVRRSGADGMHMLERRGLLESLWRWLGLV